MKRLLIAGCGDLGIRLAGLLDRSQWQVSGLRRNPSRLPDSVRPLAADLTRPSTLPVAGGPWDAVVYQATPGAREEASYRRTYIDGLNNLLAAIDCHRLIFVSSTAVYGQDAGELVDEDSATAPGAFNGRVLLEAERLAAGAATQSVVLRFSGIYGPGRDFLIRQLRAGQARCRPEPPEWTNRIHADDCAGVLAHLLELADPQPVYCASDSHPAPRCEVLEWLARRLGVPGPERLAADAGAGQGKRIVNARLLASGYTFRHPGYRSGYRAMLS